MRLVRGLNAVPETGGGSIVTLGTFDGVHRGHQALLARLVGAARDRALPAALVTFEPHPREFFAARGRGSMPARLTSLREKLIQFREAGVDRVWLLRFNRALADLEARDFAERFLVTGLAVKAVFIGDDFRFGRDRAGDVDLLRRLGKRRGFDVGAMETVEEGGRRIGSSRVRRALADGDFDLAERLLGRRYAVTARVNPGEGLGRRLGFPTANLPLKRRVFPVSGVVAVRVRGLGRVRRGIASIGTRPTVCGKRPLLEVHLFDYTENLYGRRLEVEFCWKLREEERFDDMKELARAMERDAARARAWFARQDAATT